MITRTQGNNYWVASALVFLLATTTPGSVVNIIAILGSIYWLFGAIGVFKPSQRRKPSLTKRNFNLPRESKTFIKPEPEFKFEPSLSPTGKIEQQIHRLVNDYRKSRQLTTLELDEEVSRLARDHCQSLSRIPGDPIKALSEIIVEKGEQIERAHQGSADRSNYCFKKLGRTYFSENVFYISGGSNIASDATKGWIKSPGHHANMINSSGRRTGIGVYASSKGFYCTQLFTD